MRRPWLATSAWKLLKLRRPYSPFAPLLPGYDVKMIVRHFLAAIHTIVLKREYSQRLVRFDERKRDPLRGFDYGRSFSVREVEQCFCVAPSDNAALTHLELKWIDDRESEFRFLNHCPLFISARQTFTKLTGILSWQLNHVGLLSGERQALLTEKGQFVEVSSLKDYVIVNNIKEAATA